MTLAVEPDFCNDPTWSVIPMILIWALPWIQSGESTGTHHIVSQVISMLKLIYASVLAVGG